MSTNKNWEVAARELCAIREEIRQLRQREEDIVDTFKHYGPGVYAGERYCIIVSEITRNIVDLESLRELKPELVEEFTDLKTYIVVKSSAISLKN